jgi:O-antigen ligase
MTGTHYYQTVKDERSAIDWRAGLTQIAFGLGLALVAARCMALETIRDPFDVNVGSPNIPLGAGADTSVVLDLLCCLPAILTLVRRCVDKTYRLRWSWSLVLILPLAGWMALSVRWADDKFACMASTCNFVAAMALLWAMAQLVRSWMRLRMVAGLAFGLLLVFLVQGFYYKFVDMPTMLEQQSKLLQQEGFDPHSFNAIQFEKKITELIGFNSSANSFAGLVVLFLTIGLGVAIQRIKDRDDPGWTVALGFSAPLAIWLLILAQSKAALVMPVIVVALLALLWKWRGRMARQSKRFFWIGICIITLVIFAAVGHGLYHHSLPTDSLNFRWRYWVASWRMFLRHPVRGFGWENFGEHYLRDRLSAASEEIHDPHDFIVRFLVELGAVGGILMLAWLGRLWWELTRPVTPPTIVSPIARKPQMGQVLFLATIAIGAVVLNALATVDFNQNGSFILLALFKELLYLCALVIGLMVVSLRSLEHPQVDQRAAPWVLYGILIGIGIFLIHNLIEFSMFEAGPMCLLGVLIGSALGARLGNRPVRVPGISKVAIAILAMAAVVWLAAAYWIAVPVGRAETAAHRGDEKLRAGDVQAASEEYGYAATILPFNADYAFRAGRALHLSIGPPALLSNPDQIDRAIRLRRQIESWYDIASDRDPVYLATYHLRGIFDLQLGDSRRMVEDFDELMDLNPNEVSLRLEYARGLEMLHLLPEAKKQYKLALKYDDQLDKAEPKRLSAAQRVDIEKEIAGLPD